jgi:peptidoglycan/LPS O-acetylase OafA/YrhL
MEVKYRPEIDGLRAIAILSVFFFHLFPKILSGGFLGVDVFFVISGFLISSILINQLSTTGCINFSDFYLRRVKRIIPSLLLVITFTYISGYFLMLPKDFISLGASGIATLKFISNFHFALNSDYFAPTSDEFPLLHTWSLAIEEQFYIVWPLILFLIWKTGTDKKRLALFFILIMTSVICAFYFKSVPELQAKSYFYPYSRGFELLIGCVTAYLLHSRKFEIANKYWNLITSVSLSILILSFYFVKPSTFQNPGLISLLVCMAVAFIILGTSQRESVVKKILSFDWICYIGQHSYSIYLWHWPLIAFYRYSFTHEIRWQHCLIYIILTILLSVFTKKFFEVPIYKLKLSILNALVCILLIPSAFLYGVFYQTNKLGGIPSRIVNLDLYKNESTFLSPGYCYNTHPNNKLSCSLIKNSKPTMKMLLFGDSNAGHYAPYLSEIFKGTNLDLDARFVDSCPPILNLSEDIISTIKQKSKPACLFNIKYIDSNIDKYDAFILGGNWDVLLNNYKGFNLESTLKKLETKKKVIILLSRLPTADKNAYFSYFRSKYAPWNPNSEAETKAALIDSFSKTSSHEINNKLVEIIEKFKSVVFLDPFSFNSISTQMPFMDNFLLYKDGAHLNEKGSTHLARKTKWAALRILCPHLNCGSKQPRNLYRNYFQELFTTIFKCSMLS